MVWYLECTPVITSHLQNGSAFAFLHLLNTILGLWIFNECSKYFVTECEWFGFCRLMSPCVGIFAPWIYFLCPNTRGILNMRDWIAPSSGWLSVCNAAFAMFFLFFFFNVHDYIKEWLVLFFLFPSLSLFLLTGLLGCWVCVCCFVLLFLSGCYVVMLCVKINKKKMLITKNKKLKWKFELLPWQLTEINVSWSTKINKTEVKKLVEILKPPKN